MPGISRLNLAGEYTYLNKNYAKMTGYSVNELVGSDWTRTVHPEDQEHTARAYEQMKTEGKSEFQARGMRKDGSLFYKSVLMVCIKDDDGSTVGHHCFMKDITAEKEAENALAKSENLLRSILTAVPDVIMIFDKEARYLNIFTGDPYLLPDTQENLLGRTIHEVVSDTELANKIHRIVNQSITEDRPVRFEYRMPVKNGNCWFSASIVKIEMGKPVALWAARNVTKKKKTEEMLHTISEIQNQFIINLSPEIIFSSLLDKLLALSESEYGFIGEVLYKANKPYLKTHAITNIAWNAKSRETYEKFAPNLEFNNMNTLFGAAIRQW